MTDLAKFINLLIEFGEKLEGHINKKYRPFIKTMLSLAELSKNIKPQKVALTSQMIAFRLGIESKSTKCIEMTLTYLHRLLVSGFIDLTLPNYCEDFVITDASIERKHNQKYEREIKNELVRWLEPLVHFRNNDINALVLKNYEYLIGEQILPSILEISEQLHTEQCYSLLCSFFNYRFYLYEETYCYREDEIAQFKIVPCSELLAKHVHNAHDKEEALQNLMERYLNEIVARAAGEGGKHGLCVVCDQPADFYCKITKAALCGMDCKKKHLELADKHFKADYQANYLQNSIKDSLEILSKYLSEKESPFVFSAFASLLQKPYLFQLVKPEFKMQIKNFLPKILFKGYQSKSPQVIETMYFLVSALATYWPAETLPQIQFFIKEHILRVISDKKPSFRQLLMVFKSIDKLFQSGRPTVEMYINLDCEINRVNVVGEILFELSRIAQDKFANASGYSKQQKITIKNSCVTLFLSFAGSLNEYRTKYTMDQDVSAIVAQKNRKPNLQKFVQKFNEHWSEGLKTLFNLSLVGLDSNQEIVNIIMSLAGLDKKMIDSMMFDKMCDNYLDIFLERLKESPEPLLFKLLSFYKYIPMSENDSVGILKFVEVFSQEYQDSDLLATVKNITSFLLKCISFDDFSNRVRQFHSEQSEYEYLYLRMLTARKPTTTGRKKQLYTTCHSHSYIEALCSQVSLLQIPLSYLLETNYDPERIVALVKQLIPLCAQSNWLSLLVKHADLHRCHEQLLTGFNIKIIRGAMETTIMQANFIQEWLTILNFLCSLHSLVTQNPPNSRKHLLENKASLLQYITPGMVETTLINASVNSDRYFHRLVAGVLTVAREQLVADQLFMLQKYFAVLDTNIDKYARNFEPIVEEFRGLLEQLKPTTAVDTYIYICDMLKQVLLKILKTGQASDDITVSHLQLLSLILARNAHNREVCDFIMHSLSTIVLYNYNLQPRSWKLTLQIVDEQAEQFRQQASVIIRKILNEKMRSIEGETENLLRICFKLVNPADPKSSIEAVHDIKMILDLCAHFISQQYSAQNEARQQQKTLPEEPQEVKNLHRLLCFSIEEMIKFIGCSFSEGLVETIFLLFGFSCVYGQDEYEVLTQAQIDHFIESIMQALEKMEAEDRDTAERILNETLLWSFNHKNKGIVKNLEKAIIGKQTPFSIAALKCIKAYIQISNLREQKDWEDVEHTLFNIIASTQIDKYFDLDQEQSLQSVLEQIRNHSIDQRLRDQQIAINARQFIHECKVQMMSVELLPNHRKCLESLDKSYRLKIRFNDNVVMRTVLWRLGIGRDFPPDLLALEETISNRIMSIHNWEDDSREIIAFCYGMLERYIGATRNLELLERSREEVLQAAQAEGKEMYHILVDYWNKRRQPLIKIIGYFMPKLTGYCKAKHDQKKLLLLLVKLMPIVDNKEAVIRAICDLKNHKVQ